MLAYKNKASLEVTEADFARCFDVNVLGNYLPQCCGVLPRLP